jgi:hypothetical protein
MDLPLIPILGPFGAINSWSQWAQLIPKRERRLDAIVVMGNLLPVSFLSRAKRLR